MKIKVNEKYGAVIIELKGNVMGGDDIIDLANVKFMNSSGLGMMIGGLTSVKKANGRLVLANVTDKIESLLMITKLITIFETSESVDKAVQLFSA